MALLENEMIQEIRGVAEAYMAFERKRIRRGRSSRTAGPDASPDPNRLAVGWTATIGLIPGYGHDNDPRLVAERRTLLVRLWTEAMDAVHEETGFSVSAVVTESLVLYPKSGGCPDGGEQAATLSGSSNPTYVGPDRFDDFMEAVRRVVRRVQEGMEQTSTRIEFHSIPRSIYSRLDRD